MARTKVKRVNGFVDYYNLRDYMHPEPDEAPFEPDPTRIFENHHAAYPSDLYAHDAVLREWRNAFYNQIVLPADLEERLHNEQVERMYPPLIPVAEAGLRDFQRFTELGTVALELKIATDLECEDAERASREGGFYRNMSSDQRLEFFAPLREPSIAALDLMEVLPERHITSILRRFAVYLEDERLVEIARARLDIDPVYFPIRVPGKGHLHNLGNVMLKNAFPELEKVKERQPRTKRAQIRVSAMPELA